MLRRKETPVLADVDKPNYHRLSAQRLRVETKVKNARTGVFALWLRAELGFEALHGPLVETD